MTEDATGTRVWSGGYGTWRNSMDVEFIGQSVEMVGSYGGDASVEGAARTCTQSAVDPSKSAGFVERLLRRGHLSPVEFGYAEMTLECDRAIQQEFTRHRHFSFNIESTRWIDYRKKPLRFVTKPPEGMDVEDDVVEVLEMLCAVCANVYEQLLECGVPKDYARKALPLATASKVRMGGNLRAWMEMLPKRLAPSAHPEAREIAGMVRDRLTGVSKTIFGRYPSEVVTNDLGGDGDGDDGRNACSCHDCGCGHHSAVQHQLSQVAENVVRIRLDKGAYMPERAHDTDAGADIRTPKAFVLMPHSGRIVRTGVHIETPHGFATMIKSKSGLNTKHGITAEGVIDEGFSGEILVKLYNHSAFPYLFHAGDKITQLVIVPVMYADFEQVDEISEGERGSNGYGSTGR